VTNFFRRHTVLTTAVLSVVLFSCLVWLVFVLGRPLPPRVILMTTGPDGGAMREHAEKYRALLAKERVQLKLIPSLGSVENLTRLRDPGSKVVAGFVAGGLAGPDGGKGLVSLGTISYDPVWIFCRGLKEPIGLHDLKGRRVAVGPEGGGTRPVVLELLRANQLEGTVTLLPLSPGPGGEALLRGELDCACMLTGTEAPIVRRLLADEHVSLVTFPRAEAYVALYPHLRRLIVPRGVGSLAKDLPRDDVEVMAAMTSLIVREDLHPAIQFLLLRAAEDVHGAPGIFARPGQFPAAEPIDIPLSDTAHTFFRSGGSFLQRHLPFWLAVLTQRVLLALIPIAGVLYPLLRLVPAVRDWMIELKFRRLYGDLRLVEAGFAAKRPEAEHELAVLERKVSATKVPTSHARALYTLKQHVALVSDRAHFGGVGSAPLPPRPY
jgi:hypothetical protein